MCVYIYVYIYILNMCFSVYLVCNQSRSATDILNFNLFVISLEYKFFPSPQHCHYLPHFHCSVIFLHHRPFLYKTYSNPLK